MNNTLWLCSLVVSVLTCVGCHNKPQALVPPSADTNKTESQGSMGDFSYETKSVGNEKIIRYLAKKIPISRGDFILLLANNHTDGRDFRYLVNQSIAALPDPADGNNAYMIKSPVINKAAKDEEFYFVALKTTLLGQPATSFQDYFINCTHDLGGNINSTQVNSYKNNFVAFYAAKDDLENFTQVKLKNPPITTKYDFGTSIFKGIGPSPGTIMVSPCPVSNSKADAQNAHLIGLYSFAKYVQDTQSAEKKKMLQSFWFAVGKIATTMFHQDEVKDLDNNIVPSLFLSTHGHGVNYLHFRVETTTKYYGTMATILGELEDSKKYYKKAFSK